MKEIKLAEQLSWGATFGGPFYLAGSSYKK